MIDELVDSKEFRKRISDQIKPLEREYEEARRVYVVSLRKLVIDNITGKRDFKKMYQSALEEVRYQSAWDPEGCSIDEITVLYWMIGIHEEYLDELAEDAQ